MDKKRADMNRTRRIRNDLLTVSRLMVSGLHIEGIVSVHPEIPSFDPGRCSRSFEILNVAPLRLRLQIRCGLGPEPKSTISGGALNLLFLNREMQNFKKPVSCQAGKK
jgi:hypothetical protein